MVDRQRNASIAGDERLKTATWVRRMPTVLALVLCSGSSMGCQSCRDRTIAFLDQFAKSFGEMVTVNNEDSTPPTVTLTVSDYGNGQKVLRPGDPSITLHEQQIQSDVGTILFVVTADDPEGVK